MINKINLGKIHQINRSAWNIEGAEPKIFRNYNFNQHFFYNNKSTLVNIQKSQHLSRTFKVFTM